MHALVAVLCSYISMGIEENVYKAQGNIVLIFNSCLYGVALETYYLLKS